MGWRDVLAAAQATPPPRAALDGVVRDIWPGASVGDLALLPGGLGSVLHRVGLTGAPVSSLVLRQLLREFGDDADTVRREAEVHAAAGAAAVPVPQLHWTDPDGEVLGRPALLLDLVPGRPLVADLGDAVARRAMADVVHAIAAVPTDDLRHLPRLADLDAVANRFWPPPDHSDVVDAPGLAAAVQAAAGAFEARDDLLHMDLHAGNVLWDGVTVTGVLDWPGAAVGTALFDEAYLWFDTCLAHGRQVADALQAAVDARRPGRAPTAEELHLWRGLVLQRGLPSPADWTEAYVAMGIDVDEDTVVGRYVRLVEDHLGKG